MAIKSFRDLIAWQKAMDLVETVYRASAAFPREEIYGLRSQIRQSAVSVPSNIAEGQGRKSTKEFLHFLSIAYGSLCEAQTQAILADRLGFLDEQYKSDLFNQSDEVGRLINGLADSLSRR
jgi:four helix bundle protein